MLVIEFLEPNKQSLMKKIKNNLFLSILFIMLCYWLLINIGLIITVIININHWLLITGFNLGFLASMVGLSFLYLASKWLLSRVQLKQTLAYFGFLLRMLIYGSIIVLNIFFNFANIFTIIAGMSILMFATITATLCIYQK